MRPKIFDCFTFSDELDLLELRLRVSAPHVDHFVLVEATQTFSGKEKPLHYELNRSRFSTWSDRIRHIVVDDLPISSGNRWDSEVHQRNSILRGLDGATPDDVVIVSDVDEIIDPEVLPALRDIEGLTGLEMPSTFRFANWLRPSDQFSLAARAMPFRTVEHPHNQRNHMRPERVIADAGRHFTGLGTVDRLVSKFESYAHSELDTPGQKSLAYLERAERMGMDVFSRELVTVVPETGLCATQAELREFRPDLFDFSDLPARYRREVFRWYATWRADQPQASTRIAELDHEYDSRSPSIAIRAAQGLARHLAWTVPRRKLGAIRRKYT